MSNNLNRSNPEYWAIRQKSTGHFLPALPGQRGGYTLVGPVAWWQSPPRLFTNERNAKLALKAWLRGEHHRGATTDWETGYSEPDAALTIVSVKGRDPADMEVIPMELVPRA